MNIELLSCPFCGGKEAFVERWDNVSAFVQCDSRVDEHSVCCARGPIEIQENDDEEVPGAAGAIASWNRRGFLAAALASHQQVEQETLTEAAKQRFLSELESCKNHYGETLELRKNGRLLATLDVTVVKPGKKTPAEMLSETPDVSGSVEDYPMQPVVTDANGRHRFKENRIVRALVDHGAKTGFGLNEIAVEAAHGKFTSGEQMQLAQLIGYSVSGYGTLSYVSDESYSAAEAQSDALSAHREQQGGAQ